MFFRLWVPALGRGLRGTTNTQPSTGPATASMFQKKPWPGMSTNDNRLPDAECHGGHSRGRS